MTEDKRYNGWANYETWNVALWIDNEQGSYRARQKMAEDAWKTTEYKRTYSSQTREDSAKCLLADSLKDWIEEMAPDLGASMFADLLNAALGEVDWYEMADNFLEDVEKDETDEEESEQVGK